MDYFTAINLAWGAFVIKGKEDVNYCHDSFFVIAISC